MLVRELIAKLQTCPLDAPVCWDSREFDRWYGSEVEIIPTTHEEVVESMIDAEEVADEFPRDLTCVVKLS